MNELQTTSNRTPIEIALGVDENGMTTAKKLYAFLELNPGNFSRWCKSNITENQFAEEGTDFLRLFNEEETPTGGKILREDFNLTAHFAKKLSMLQKNERGEEARNYFTKVEDGAKDMVEQIQKLSPELQAIFLHDKKIQQVDTKVDAVNKDLQEFKMDLPILGIEIDRITTAVHRRGVNALGGKESNAYNDRSLRGQVYSDIYRELKRQFGVSTYKAIKRSQCDLAISVVDEYELPLVLAEKVKDCNAQMNIDVA